MTATPEYLRERYQALQRLGLCVRCSQPATKGLTMYPQCLTVHRNRARVARDKARGAK